MRLTWVQPEDLVGHGLAQAAEEGNDVAAIAERWRRAGGVTAPSRDGASPAAGDPARRQLAAELLDQLDALLRPLAADEPDEVEPARVPQLQVDGGALARRIQGAWLGRAAGCLLGKPVEKVPREGIRELLESAGRWPLDSYFSARGVAAETLERRRWNRGSAATSLAENIDGMPEDDDLNYTLVALHVLERHGHGFRTEDVAQAWLDLLPAARVFTAERLALRNLLLGFVPPETATRWNPFREWIGARIRVELYGWANPGDPAAAAAAAIRDARLSHTANGVYAAAWMAAVCAAAVAGADVDGSLEVGLAVVPPRSRLAVAIRDAVALARAEPEWERVVDELYRRHGALHWVHAINNTALVAAALAHFGGDFSRAICGVVAGGWDTDSNGAAVGSVVGAVVGPEGIEPRWTAPLHDRLATSVPGFDGASFTGLARRTLAVARAGTAG